VEAGVRLALERVAALVAQRLPADAVIVPLGHLAGPEAGAPCERAGRGGAAVVGGVGALRRVAVGRWRGAGGGALEVDARIVAATVVTTLRVEGRLRHAHHRVHAAGGVDDEQDVGSHAAGVGATQEHLGVVGEGGQGAGARAEYAEHERAQLVPVARDHRVASGTRATSRVSAPPGPW
jgi:hypothetical protein